MKFLALIAVFSGLFVGGCINKTNAIIADTSPVSVQSDSQGENLKNFVLVI